MTYGCFNRPAFKKLYKGQNGWMNGKQVEMYIVFNMTQDCQYTHTDLGQADNRCKGCKWRKNGN